MKKRVGIALGSKVVPLDETCSEWRKAKEKGQPYLTVVAVQYRQPEAIYALTANENPSVFGATAVWRTAETFVLYEENEWADLFKECNKLRLLMKIDQALENRDKVAFLALTEELKKGDEVKK